MRYAIYDGEIVQADKIGLWHHDSYTCLECHAKVSHIRESHYNGAYFRHHASSDCPLSDERSSNYINRMSNFYIQWQGIFPISNIGTCGLSNGIHIDLIDQLPPSLNSFLSRNFQPKSLMIEIQASRITKEEVEQELKSHTDVIRRQLLWIFNAQGSGYEIYRVVTMFIHEFRLKIMNGRRDFLMIFEISRTHPCVILDDGSENLYLIRDVMSDYIVVKPLKRSGLLECFSHQLSMNLKWVTPELPSVAINDFNYEEVLSSLPMTLDKASLQECFYMMEIVPFQWYISTEFWRNQPGFLHVGDNLSRLSGSSEIVRDIWIRWVMRHRELMSHKITSGPHRGKDILELSEYHLREMNRGEFSVLKMKLMLLDSMTIDNLTSQFNNPRWDTTNGSLVYLCRVVFNDENWLPPQRNF